MIEKYRSGSAGHQMLTEIVKVRQSNTIKDIISILSKNGNLFKLVDYIYVVDKKEKLVGVVSLGEIFNYPRNTRVSKIMKKEVAGISPDAEDEKAAHLALKHGIKAVPVVEKGKLLGAIPAKKLISVLNRSLQEDILHFAGIHRSHLNYENTTKVPLLLSVLHRVPWLIIGLIGIMITAALLGVFESALEKYIILAFFIPAILYMSAALGTQHQTLFVRDLAILGREINLGYYFLRQTSIAVILGLLISSLTLLGIFIFWNEFFIGLVIAISLFAALMITNFTSLLITLALYRLGRDPALGAGPFATLISDMTSIAIYFLIASWLLV